MKIIDIKNYECVGLNTFPSKPACKPHLSQ